MDRRKGDKRIREHNAERQTPSLVCIFASKDRDERVPGTGPEHSQQQHGIDVWSEGPKLQCTMSSSHRTVCPASTRDKFKTSTHSDGLLLLLVRTYAVVTIGNKCGPRFIIIIFLYTRPSQMGRNFYRPKSRTVSVGSHVTLQMCVCVCDETELNNVILTSDEWPKFSF